jgi:hypothetical protein
MDFSFRGYWTVNSTGLSTVSTVREFKSNLILNLTYCVLYGTSRIIVDDYYHR